ncbi:MAG: hypothetical protein U1F45_08905 [Burkholderiales bacterium]
MDFDLMLVDGPSGVEHFPGLAAGRRFPPTAEDFILVFDDCVRPGERETWDSCVTNSRRAALTFMSGP